MTDAEEQSNEVLALQSIYEGNSCLHLLEEKGRHKGIFTALQAPRQPFVLEMNESTQGPYSAGHSTERKVKEVPIQHLPPVKLDFVLPFDYPSAHAPQFTLSCEWMSKQQLSRLCGRLDEIWEKSNGDVILFLWFQFLEDETLEYLQLCGHFNIEAVTESFCMSSSLVYDQCLSPQDNWCHLSSSLENFEPNWMENNSSDSADPRAIVYPVSDVSQMLTALVVYDRERRLEVFESSTVLCKICFTSKGGLKSMFFYDCHHAYCKECICTYFTLQIREGKVTDLKCPFDGCKTTAFPNQVKEVVRPEDYARFEKLLVQFTIDSMRDVVYCPRRRCQSPVIVESDNRNMGRCPVCCLVFCTSCRKTYHGLAPCEVRSHNLKKLRRKYLRANAEKKRSFEREHGKNTIHLALMEDTASTAWLTGNAKPCPYCGIYIQKVVGCNKVTCSKCRSFFCWLCGALLPRADPYSHFNAQGDQCFQRLFAGARMEEENILPGFELPEYELAEYRFYESDESSLDEFDDDDELEDWEVDFWEPS